MALKTLFSGQAADGNSSAVQVTAQPGNAQQETVAVQAYGTWSGATVTFQVCLDPAASPQQWATVQTSPGTNLAVTADWVENLELMSGCALRAVLSGSGSPLPSLTVKALGQIASA